MFDGFFPQTSHDYLYKKRLLESLERLLQTIGSHVVDQLHSPLRPISSPRLYQGNPSQHSLHILSGKGRSMSGELNRQKRKPDGHITRHT